ncbi:MAG: TonB-dependent receptor plug domain-containing protein [Rhizobiales bacterium]|nr:TonB-dependent receptor plug domain-containing protein [Hyphomicrobiales bacterium]
MEMFSIRYAWIVTALVLHSGAAFAQTIQLDEVRVTANKRDQELGRVDGAVSVQTADDLQRAEVKNVADLEKVFPGLVIRQRGNRAYSTFTVRGMSSPDFYNPTVQVYVDGVPQSDAFLTQELVDVERVEFLRGPQGTLYGRNAYSGVINIITRRPRANRVLGGLTATNRTLSGHLYATGTYRDAWFMDLAVRGFDDRGQITDPTTGNKVDTVKTWSGKAQWRYAPFNGPFDATFYVAKERMESREEIYVLDSQINQRLYPVGVPYPLLDRDTLSSALSWNYAFGPFKLSSITSYQDVDLDRRLFGSHNPETTKSWSQEVRVTYDADGPLTGVAGLYYQDTGFSRSQLTGLHRRSEVDSRAAAAFGEFSYALTDRLAVTAGGRVSRDEADIRYRGAFSFDNSASFTGFQPKISLGYQVTDQTRVYGLVSRGYKAGGFNHAVSTIADADPYLPETATNYEVGARSSFWNGRLLFSGAVYHIDSKDKQIYVGVVPNMVIRNVGEASSTGVELEATLRPTDLLTLNGSMTYGVSRFDRFIDPTTLLDYSGNRVPYAPDMTVHLSFRQVIPQTWWAGELAVTGALHYFGKTYFDEANTLGQPAYTMFDLGLEAELRKGVTFKVFGTNIGNEIYRTYSYRAGPNIFSNIGQGRIVGAALRATL